MSKSAVNSFDIDMEKFVEPPLPFGRLDQQYVERQPRALSRTHRGSRNFSHPSPAASVSDSVENWPKRRRSSDEDAAQPQYRRAHSVTPDFAPSPMSSKLPPFAPKTMPNAWRPEVLRDPPPVLPLSAASTKRSRKSTDVLEAAKHVPWHNPAWESTRSLMSTIRDKSQQQSSSFARRVFEAGKPDLLYDLRETRRFKDRRHGVLDLTTLQRMNQHVLQQKLVEQVKAMGEKGAWMEIGIQQTMHDYCKSVGHKHHHSHANSTAGESLRDMDYMEQCALRGTSNDPFLLSTAKPLDCKLLEEAGLAFGDPRKKLNQTGPDRLAYTKRESLSKRGLRRLFMSLLGALALIAPFLVMLLVAGQLVRLIATCGFVIVFAVAVAIGSEMAPDRIALVTAAYAAALVVFVGTHPPEYRY